MDTDSIITLGQMLKKLMAKKTEPIIEKYDLRPVELDILVFLHNEKFYDTAKAIMKKKRFSKAHISKSVDNLHKKGYIDISGDKNDHRLMHITLTEKSAQVIEEALVVYQQCRTAVLNGVSEQEFAVLDDIASRILNNISDELGELNE